MATLLLRLAAPLQAWGANSKFEIRNTEREPTKSGVIGLLAAALGRSREDSMTDLCQLRFGIRVDQEGKLLRDFHMAKSKKDSYVTNRYYLSDAIFLVALETENTELLKEIDYSLNHPAYPLFLGRRSCPPSFPLNLGIYDMSMLECLKQYPSLVPEWSKKKGKNCRIIYDDMGMGIRTSRCRDIPISFSQKHRQHGYRLVAEEQIAVLQKEHDPMQKLR